MRPLLFVIAPGVVAWSVAHYVASRVRRRRLRDKPSASAEARLELFTQAGATQAAAAVVLEAADSALAICRRHFRPTDRFSVELRSPLGPLAIDDDPDLIVDYIHLLLRRSGVNRPAYPEGYGHEDSLGELARSVSMAMAVSDG